MAAWEPAGRREPVKGVGFIALLERSCLTLYASSAAASLGIHAQRSKSK
jgi:hypothetical protein